MALDKAYPDTIDLVRIAKEVRGVIVQIVVPLQNGNSSIGSGFWVNDRGYVATCWHVVKDNPNATMKVQSAIDSLFDLKNNNMIFANWEVFPGKVVARDLRKLFSIVEDRREPI